MTARVLELDVARWDASVDAADETMLARCDGPTLDIGCGPGRLVAALACRGMPCLGVDVASWAVHSTRSAGAAALRRSVFDRIPGAGRWSTALLADGNVGIGGDPAALAARVAELLAPGGLLLCEVEHDDVDDRLLMRLQGLDGTVSPASPWARVGLSAAQRVLTSTGYDVVESWVTEGRRFLAARTPATAAVSTATAAMHSSQPRQ